MRDNTRLAEKSQGPLVESFVDVLQARRPAAPGRGWERRHRRDCDRKVRPLSVTKTAAQKTAVVLDPHPLWIEALEEVLARVDVVVVAKTTSAAEAVELVAEHAADLLVADIEDDPLGVDCVRLARERRPALKAIVLSALDDQDRIARAFAAGAAAYVVKTAQPDDVCAAVRQAFEHSVYFAGSGASAPPPPAEEVTAVLTRRELEILQLVAEGHSNAQVGRMLWVTEQTVKFHLSNVYRKLDVSNRTEASRWAQVRNLLPSPREGGGEVASAAAGSR
jgi:DNA-binding NarL/FixJ family response regulator